MMKQNEAVYKAIQEVKGTLTKDLTKEEITQIAEIVTGGILNGSVRFDSHEKYDTPEKVYGYVKGMVKNWLRKGKELGNNYKPAYTKGPQKSETQKALEALLEKYPNNEEVKTALAAHIEEKAATKVKTKTINVDALPEHLKKFVI